MSQGQISSEQRFCGVVVSNFHQPIGCDNMSKNLNIGKRETNTITIAEGKKLFKANCSSCHARDMKTKLTGPTLSGIEERWSKYPREDLYSFIRNSEKMIEDKHPKAIELWEEWQTVMTSYPNLTDDQTESILLYINDSCSIPGGRSYTHLIYLFRIYGNLVREETSSGFLKYF